MPLSASGVPYTRAEYMTKSLFILRHMVNKKKHIYQNKTFKVIIKVIQVIIKNILRYLDSTFKYNTIKSLKKISSQKLSRAR